MSEPLVVCVNCEALVPATPICAECGRSTTVEIQWCEFCRTAPAVTAEAPYACEPCSQDFAFGRAVREEALLAFAGL